MAENEQVSGRGGIMIFDKISRHPSKGVVEILDSFVNSHYDASQLATWLCRLTGVINAASTSFEGYLTILSKNIISPASRTTYKHEELLWAKYL